MSTTARQFHLNAFLMGAGHHEAAWRHPAPTPPRGSPTSALPGARAHRRARQARLASSSPTALACGRTPSNANRALEPLTLLSAIAVATEHIGLIATASTTYNEPYNLARKFASLDHISGGRAGWNIVTSAVRARPRATSASTSSRPRGAVRARRRSSSTSSPSCGTAGRTTRWCRHGDAASSPTRRRCTRSTTAATHFRVARPAQRRRAAAGPAAAGAGRLVRGRQGASRPGTPRPSSPRSQTLDDGAGVLQRPQGPGRRVRPRPRPPQVLPGIVPFIGGTEAEANALRASSSTT